MGSAGVYTRVDQVGGRGGAGLGHVVGGEPLVPAQVVGLDDWEEIGAKTEAGEGNAEVVLVDAGIAEVGPALFVEKAGETLVLGG